MCQVLVFICFSVRGLCGQKLTPFPLQRTSPITACLFVVSIIELFLFGMLAGKTGLVKLDDNADRIGDYEVWHLNADNASSYQPLLYIINTSPLNDTDVSVSQ